MPRGNTLQARGAEVGPFPRDKRAFSRLRKCAEGGLLAQRPYCLPRTSGSGALPFISRDGATKNTVVALREEKQPRNKKTVQVSPDCKMHLIIPDERVRCCLWTHSFKRIHVELSSCPHLVWKVCNCTYPSLFPLFPL